MVNGSDTPRPAPSCTSFLHQRLPNVLGDLHHACRHAGTLNPRVARPAGLNRVLRIMGRAPSSVVSSSTRATGKFSQARPKVDSGASETRRRRAWEALNEYSKPRPDERFKRISAKLLGEVLEGAHCEAIVLDVRDEADFDAQHIEGAELYPARRFMHSSAPFTRELLEFKNRHPDRVVVLYCDDERVSAPAAELLFEKGWDNVLVLTGGLRRFRDVCPHLVSLGAVVEDLAQFSPFRRGAGSSVSSEPGTSARTPPADMFAAHLAPPVAGLAAPFLTETRAQFTDPRDHRRPAEGAAASRRGEGDVGGQDWRGRGEGGARGPGSEGRGRERRGGRGQGAPRDAEDGMGIPDADSGPMSPPSPAMVRKEIEGRQGQGRAGSRRHPDAASVALTEDSMAVKLGAMRGTRAALLFKEQQEKLRKASGSLAPRWQPTGR